MKVKVYLDTNVIFGFFKNFFIGKKLPFTWKVWFLSKNKNKIYACTSPLAISEAVSEMLKLAEKEGITISERDVEEAVHKLIEYCGLKILKDVRMDNLVLLTLHKIDVKDCLHLEISKRNNMVLITDDQDLKEKGKYFYSKILSFCEFAKMVDGSTQNRTGLSAL